MLRLAKAYSGERLEAASQRALLQRRGTRSTSTWLYERGCTFVFITWGGSTSGMHLRISPDDLAKMSSSDGEGTCIHGEEAPQRSRNEERRPVQ
jgi:hypothetical protein